MIISMRKGTEGVIADSAVVPAVGSFDNTTSDPGVTTVYSGVKFDADGDVYRRQLEGGWSRVGTWLINGTNTDFSVARTITSGSLTTDAGAGDLQLNADRIFDVQETMEDSTTAGACSFVISNWNGGSPNVVYDNRSYSFSATKLP